MLALALTIHLLLMAIWVGGMFFTFVVLRPAVRATLAECDRLRLWDRLLRRFFLWIWLTVFLLPASGLWMVFHLFGGVGHSPQRVHAMMGIGVTMIAVSVVLYFVPVRRLSLAVGAGEWAQAQRHLAWVCRLVGLNLTLGMAVVLVAGGGRFYGVVTPF